MKSIAIHVGPHKTASSAIQHILDHHRDSLAEKTKTLYPSGGTYFPNAQHDLANSALRQSGLEELVQQKFLRESKSFDKIILSSESFSKLRVDDWNYLLGSLRDSLNPKEIRMVYVMRHGTKYLESIKTELVKAGANQAIELPPKALEHYLLRLENFYLEVFPQHFPDVKVNFVDYSDSVVEQVFELLAPSLKDMVDPSVFRTKVNASKQRGDEAKTQNSTSLMQALSRIFAREDIMSGPLPDERDRFLERDRLIKEIYSQRKEIHALRSSISWKITRPLRLVGSMGFVVLALLRKFVRQKLRG